MSVEAFIRDVRENAMRLQRLYKLSSAAAIQEAFEHAAVDSGVLPAGGAALAPLEELRAIRNELIGIANIGTGAKSAEEAANEAIARVTALEWRLTKLIDRAGTH